MSEPEDNEQKEVWDIPVERDGSEQQEVWEDSEAGRQIMRRVRDIQEESDRANAAAEREETDRADRERDKRIEAEKKLEAAEAALRLREEASRKRTADEAGLCDDLLEELICPITGRLPADAVMAKDGRVYERQDLMLWFEKTPGPTVKSPVSGENMSKEIVQAYQFQNTLEKLVSCGTLKGEAVDEWKKAKDALSRYDTQMKKWFVEAATGDATAMMHLGFAFRQGGHGAEVDHAKSVEWFRKGAVKGNTQSWASLGVAYMTGRGVERHPSRALVFLTHAASNGSEHGCCAIAHALASGRHMPPDYTLAKYWYQKSRTATIKDAIDAQKQRCEAFLAEHAD